MFSTRGYTLFLQFRCGYACGDRAAPFQSFENACYRELQQGSDIIQTNTVQRMP
jgi:hypothetical protein